MLNCQLVRHTENANSINSIILLFVYFLLRLSAMVVFRPSTHLLRSLL